MDNPYRRAISQAVRDGRYLRTLFRSLGAKDNPNTQIMVGYRLARNSIQEIAQSPVNRAEKLLETRRVFSHLETTVRTASLDLLDRAIKSGEKSAISQAVFYGEKIAGLPNDEIQDLKEQSYKVIKAKLDTQSTASQAIIYSGGDTSRIVGDASRSGILVPWALITTAVFWIAASYWDAFGRTSYNAGLDFQKQAIAALDHHTTDCCLRVHGQIQPLNGRFELTGTPRFADRLDWSPFHHYCRTSIALYLPQFDTGETDRMIDGAQTILSERAAGINKVRQPSNAFIDD